MKSKLEKAIAIIEQESLQHTHILLDNRTSKPIKDMANGYIDACARIIPMLQSILKEGETPVKRRSNFLYCDCLKKYVDEVRRDKDDCEFLEFGCKDCDFAYIKKEVGIG